MTDDPQMTDPSRQPPVRSPGSAMLALLVMGLAVVAFLTGVARTMASAPSSSNDFLVEKVALIGALLLFFLSLAAFVVPGIRRASALIAAVTVCGLILFSSLAS
jgi:hypothetical protein